MSLISPTWTPGRVEELKRLFESNYTCSQMAREIGVTRNAVIGKLSRLGLSRPKGDNGIPRRSSPRLAPRQTQVRLLRAVLAEMQAPAAEVEISCERRCSLLELGAATCRWPIGRPGTDDFGFCGDGPVAGLPYCPRHCRLAYRSAAQR